MSYKDFVAAVCGAIVSELVLLPISTIKTNYQTKNYSLTETVYEIYYLYGIKGFYSSFNGSLISQIISTSSKFYCNKYYDKCLPIDNIYLKNIVNGILTGFCSNLATHPVDVLNIYNQNHQIDILFKEYEKHGMSVYYKGFEKSIWKHVLLSILLFPIYKYFLHKFKNIIYASLCTSLIITVLIQPIEYLRIKKMSGSTTNITSYYRGIFITLLRSIPHLLLTVLTIKVIQKMLKNF